MAVTQTRAPRQTHADLARQVADVIRGGGFSPGDRLGETRFASRLGVSRTPVRAAFSLLAQAGVLERVPGRGYFLNRALNDIPDALTDTLSSVEDKLGERILADRASRRLDAEFTIAALSRRYDAPRATVLNAIKVLQQDGLVAPTQGRAWTFRPLIDTANAAADSVDYRLVLEPAAITAPGFRMDVGEARRVRRLLQDVFESEAPRTFTESDAAFHALVARSSGNRFHRDALLAHSRLRVVGGATGQPATAFRIRQATAEHLAILDSLENGLFDVAATQMELHLRRARIQRPATANRGSPPLPRARGPAP